LIKEYLDSKEEVIVALEQVSTRPTDGVASAGVFMRQYGFLRGAILSHGNAQLIDFLPRVWRGIVGLKPGDTKSVSLTKAMELCVGVNRFFLKAKDDGKAEAFLIAYADWIKWKRGIQTKDVG